MGTTSTCRGREDLRKLARGRLKSFGDGDARTRGVEGSGASMSAFGVEPRVQASANKIDGTQAVRIW
jgi:hypothetical protein